MFSITLGNWLAECFDAVSRFCDRMSRKLHRCHHCGENLWNGEPCNWKGYLDD